MNEIERAKREPLVSAKDSGYARHPHIHTDLSRAPITFLWWASTPAGRESKFFHTETFYRVRSSGKLGRDEQGNLLPVFAPTEYYDCTDLELRNLLVERGPFNRRKLPSGYAWHGPYLWSVLRPPQRLQPGFAWKTPESSEGTPIGYASSGLATATRLAQSVLASRAVPA